MNLNIGVTREDKIVPMIYLGIQLFFLFLF